MNRSLSTYFNTGCLSKIDLIYSLILHRMIFLKNAFKISNLYNFQYYQNDNTSVQKNIVIEKYKGINPYVLKLINYFNQRNTVDLIGVYIHGSLASNEEVKYSDFDGLIIVKDECLSSPIRLYKLALLMYKSLKIIYKIDPLQHHGWFVLTESDLKKYPQTYFPYEILYKTRVLIGSSELSLTLESPDRDYVDTFNSFSESLMNRLKDHNKINTLYKIKSFYSQVLLLPSKYYLSRFNNGIYKKDSFQFIKQEFENDQLEVIDQVSLVREKWDQSCIRCQFLFQIINPLFRKVIVNTNNNIPESLNLLKDNSFHLKLKNLITEMQAKLV